ncbi:hypothetical protein PtB15_12B292 [Puccinia triticina]|nr:hypothetical protein PtB15_12B292 [Puccinia triticina]
MASTVSDSSSSSRSAAAGEPGKQLRLLSAVTEALRNDIKQRALQTQKAAAREGPSRSSPALNRPKQTKSPYFKRAFTFLPFLFIRVHPKSPPSSAPPCSAPRSNPRAICFPGDALKNPFLAAPKASAIHRWRVNVHLPEDRFRRAEPRSNWIFELAAHQ